MIELCSTCLCKDRRLVPLKSLENVLSSLSWLNLYFSEGDQVCWECKAMFTKVHSFRQQAWKAQELMRLHTQSVQASKCLPYLSHLSSTINSTYDETIYHDDVVKEERAAGETAKTQIEIDIEEGISIKTEMQPKIVLLKNYTNDFFTSNEENVVQEVISNRKPEINNRKPTLIKIGTKVRPVPRQILSKAGPDEHQTGKDESAGKERKLPLEELDKHHRHTEPITRTINVTPVQDPPDFPDDFSPSDEDSVAREAGNDKPKLIKIGTIVRPGQELLPKNGLNKHQTSADEEKFVVRRMSHEEMEKAREADRSGRRYSKCPYKCVKCITGYYNLEGYNRHVKIYHSESAGKFACPICEVRFKRKEGLEYHHDCHFRSYQCRQCPYEHHRLNTMIIHLTKEHENRKYECKLCNIEFLQDRQLKYHRDKCHSGPKECNICGRILSTPSALKFHMKVHGNNVASEECPTCGGMYRHLRSHMRTHRPATENAYCAECDRQYKSVECYRRHLATSLKHRQPDDELVECTECDEKFLTKLQRATHVTNKHKQLVLLYCDTCGKGFQKKHTLRLHIMKHQGIAKPKNNICTYCGTGFHSKTILRDHTNRHTGARPYACTTCGATFGHSAALYTHNRLKHGTKQSLAKKPRADCST